MAPLTLASTNVPSRFRRRAAMVSTAVLVVAAILGATFIPKVANHFGYALPGERGLPYQVHYNGRDYRNVGSSHAVFTAGVVPPGETATRVIVEASHDCYLTYDLVGGP